MNDNDIGKIERGVVSWPGSERRAALKKVLGAVTDAELGFVNSRALFTESGPTARRVEQLAMRPMPSRLRVSMEWRTGRD